MIGDKSSYKETPCIDSPTDRCPGIYSYLSGAVRLLVSRLTGQLDLATRACKPQNLTPFDTNWKKGSGATPLTTQDL